MQRARARGSELTLVSFLHTAGCSPRCSGGFQARSAQGAAVQFSVIYSLCRIESNSSFPSSLHLTKTLRRLVCLPFRPCSVLSALSSRNIGLRGTSRFCVNPSLLRAFSAACLLRCVRSLLRAIVPAACFLSTLLRASSIPLPISKAILSYPIHNSLLIRTVALENQAPTHPHHPLSSSLIL